MDTENIPPNQGTQDRLCSSELRKVNKPLMEKRRRERINKCLDQLKAMLMEVTKQENTYCSKLEKADILELTVRYLKNARRNKENMPEAASSSSTSAPVDSKYASGFIKCKDEVLRYLNSKDSTLPQVKEALEGHLSSCLLRRTSANSQSSIPASCAASRDPLADHSFPQPCETIPRSYETRNISTNVIPDISSEFQNQGLVNSGSSANLSESTPMRLIPAKLENGSTVYVLVNAEGKCIARQTRMNTTPFSQQSAISDGSTGSGLGWNGNSDGVFRSVMGKEGVNALSTTGCPQLIISPGAVLCPQSVPATVGCHQGIATPSLAGCHQGIATPSIVGCHQGIATPSMVGYHQGFPVPHAVQCPPGMPSSSKLECHQGMPAASTLQCSQQAIPTVWRRSQTYDFLPDTESSKNRMDTVRAEELLAADTKIQSTTTNYQNQRYGNAVLEGRLRYGSPILEGENGIEEVRDAFRADGNNNAVDTIGSHTLASGTSVRPYAQGRVFENQVGQNFSNMPQHISDKLDQTQYRYSRENVTADFNMDYSDAAINCFEMSSIKFSAHQDNVQIRKSRDSLSEIQYEPVSPCSSEERASGLTFSGLESDSNNPLNKNIADSNQIRRKLKQDDRGGIPSNFQTLSCVDTNSMNVSENDNRGVQLCLTQCESNKPLSILSLPNALKVTKQPSHSGSPAYHKGIGKMLITIKKCQDGRYAAYPKRGHLSDLTNNHQANKQDNVGPSFKSTNYRMLPNFSDTDCAPNTSRLQNSIQPPNPLNDSEELGSMWRPW